MIKEILLAEIMILLKSESYIIVYMVDAKVSGIFESFICIKFRALFFGHQSFVFLASHD